MHRQVVAGFVAVLLFATVAGAAPAVADASQSALLAQPEGFDETTFEITVMENGSAEWSVKHHRRLANESEVRQFERFAERFRTEETELYRNFVTRAEALTDIGSNATGRPMNATGFSRDARTGVTASFDDRGTVELSFVWTHFAETQGDTVVVSDVFEGGFSIQSGQSLIISRGPGLAFANVDPEPDSQETFGSLAESESVTWEGEQSFASGRPYVELVPRDQVGGGEAEGQTESETTATPLTSGADNPAMWLVGAVLVVLGISGVIALRSGTITLPRSDGESARDGADPAAETPVDTGAAGSDSQTPIPEEELLSDSDRVIQLLEENGGRMKQVNIVEETEWSKSKVSMLLSDMEDEGEISKLRVGRENIISLAGHEPDAAGSPFEDEQ